VSWSETGTLVVRVTSSAWRLEVVRAKGVIADRLTRLLGPGAVRRIQIIQGG
jgi:hypothetical protein